MAFYSFSHGHGTAKTSTALKQHSGDLVEISSVKLAAAVLDKQSDFGV